MSPFKTTTDFKLLQNDVGKWAEKNFGGLKQLEANTHYHHQPLLGIIEELGELVDAVRVIKRIDSSDQIDAVGDVMIYMADYCYVLGINMEHVTSKIIRVVKDIDNISLIGKLCHAHLKMEQNIRGNRIEHLGKIIYYLQHIYSSLCWYCWKQNLDFDECISVTWEKVQKRNWTKNTENGGVD